MKIFKLKFLALTLAASALVSCAKDDVIKEADIKAISESNSFEFPDEINNYIIDGKITYDRREIANSAKDAWSIIYDYPQKKIVICTTPSELERYEKSDLVHKKTFETNPNYNHYYDPSAPIFESFVPNQKILQKKDKYLTSRGTGKGTGQFTPNTSYDINTHRSEDDSKDLVLHMNFPYYLANQTYFNVDLYSTNDATILSTVQMMSLNPRPGGTETVTNANFKRDYLMECSQDTYSHSVIINSSSSIKTLKVFENINKGGRSQIYYIKPNHSLHINKGLCFLNSQGIYKGAKSLQVY